MDDYISIIYREIPMTTTIDELSKYSDPKRVLKLAKKYYKLNPPPQNCIPHKPKKFGQLIGNFDNGTTTTTGLYTSTRKNKKYMLFNGCKTVHFGQIPYEDFTKHKNKTRRKNYLIRSNNIKGKWKNDKYSPNNLAINLLW
jgi:hypothetical protein